MKIEVTENQRCLVTDDGGRLFFSTPRAVALSMLALVLEEAQEVGGAEVAATGAPSVQWTDLLASHGVMFGTQGARSISVVALPRRERAVIKYPELRFTTSFPPILLGLVTEGGRYVRGMVMLIDEARKENWGLISPTPVLVPFPYGNIYSESGYICWGTVPHADIRSIQDLESLFFSSGFNADLFAVRTAGVVALAAGTMPTPPQEAYTVTFPAFIERLIRR